MIDTYWLGFLDMERKLLFQEELFQNLITSARSGAPANDSLIFAEHPPCFSIQKDTNLQFVKNRSLFERVTKDGRVPIIKMHRGGSITYHGPGQLVVSSVLNLTACGLKSVEEYFLLLERICIAILQEYGVTGITGREGHARGVWVEDPRWDTEPERKIVSLGTRCRAILTPETSIVSAYIVSGGFSLNIATDLSYFSLIHPCGLIGRKATSIKEVLGYIPPSKDIRELICKLLANALDMPIALPMWRTI
ncbi:MAG: lipoyl(octanoyl) transferase [Parcubacteria group bacterium Gr01-1014_29]|nr:MAG: lipoyl(octanoyl) transferase [Parcubacteria group bacterium Gr01-1014_29]